MITPKLSKQAKKLKPGTIEAVSECVFNDPYFIGGSCQFSFVETKSHVDRIYKAIDAVVSDLVSVIPKTRINAIDAQLEEIRSSREWMLSHAKN